MSDGLDFEARLRDALHREVADLPLRIDAMAVNERLASPSRIASWLLPIALPVGAALVVAALLLNVFPGQPPQESGAGRASASPSAESSDGSSVASTATPTPAPTAHPASREDAATATADGRLYLVGGRGGGGHLTSAVMFDGRLWTDLPPLPESRVGAAAAVLPDGRLLVAGGESDGQPVESTFLLTPGEDAWADGPPMPDAQSFMGTATIDGRVYLFGGSVVERSRDVLILDPSAGWTTGAPMPMGASRGAVAAVDGAAYVFGGRLEPDGGDLATALRYDPPADAWQSLADMPGAGSNISATAADREIWVLGELSPGAPDAGSQPSSAWVYDVDSDTWTVRTSSSFWPGVWHAALLLSDGRILVVGGWPNFAVDTVETREP
jgi:N-acetylneuraminic acid mutarotase